MIGQYIARTKPGLLPLALVALVLTAAPADARWYKWVDENGRISYQDKPPPANHTDSTQVLNRQGVTVENIPGEKEQKRKTIELANQERAHRRDKALIDSFPTMEDLTRTRDKRLGSIDGTVSRMHDQLVILNTRLASIDSKIEDRVAQGKKPGSALDSDRIAVMRGIASTNALIKSKLRERRQIASKFSTDLVRYRELMGHTESASIGE